MPLIPNYRLAYCEANKVRDFILTPEHDDNKGRAVVFFALGYNKAHWEALANDLCSQLLPHVDAVEVPDIYGRRFIVEGPLEGPSGTAIVRTVWLVDIGQDAPRLVTAYPEVTL